MGYEKEVLARARKRHQEAVDQFQRTQRERRERVYREYPRVQELDQQLRQTMAEFMAETFRNGQDPREAVELLRRKNLHLQQERRDILRRSGYGENYLQRHRLCRGENVQLFGEALSGGAAEDPDQPAFYQSQQL